jgi:hypothetical protein
VTETTDNPMTGNGQHEAEPSPVEAAQDSRLDRIGLALAHRLGSLGLLLLIVGIAMIGRMPFYWHLLPAAFLAAEIGMLGGLLAWVRTRGRDTGAKARNAMIFCAVIVVVSLALLVLIRFELI